MRPARFLPVLAAALLLHASASAASDVPPGKEEMDRVSAAMAEAIEKARAEGADRVSVAVDLSGAAASGDIVTVRVSAKTGDGTPLGEQVEEVVAGAAASVPGLAEAVVGIRAGELRNVVVPPEKGFGAADPEKISRFPRVRSVPRTVRLGAKDFVDKAGSFPSVGRTVDLTPYVVATVSMVTDNAVEMTAAPKDPGRFDEEIGTINARVEGDAVVMRLEPRIGAPFPGEGTQGRIVSVDNDAFSVDYNHPMAGKSYALAIEAVTIESAAALPSIAWVEGHDAPLAGARRDGKPAVLVLYADWCQWCKKFFAETAVDPRVRRFAGRIAFARVNSDKEKAYYEKYRQDGFPAIVLFSAAGEPVKTISGFRDGAAFSRELTEAFGAR
jgi:FKBP-type peptidyl-prolyl cis-trans isomerase 2